MMKALSFPGNLGLGWNVAIVFVSMLLATYLAQSITSYRRLRAFKGPLWASYSEIWLAYKTFSGGLYLTLRDISNEYGAWKQMPGSRRRRKLIRKFRISRANWTKFAAH